MNRASLRERCEALAVTLGGVDTIQKKTEIIYGWAQAQAAAILGRLGGASKSTAKQKASKKNGRKGGRPKKVVDKAAQ